MMALLWRPSTLPLLLIPCLVTTTATTARRVLYDCDTPLLEQLKGKAPTRWQSWNHRSKCKKEAAHPAAYGKPKPKPKSKPNKLKPKSPPKTNHPPPTPRGNTATSRRGVPNEYDLQARCRPSGLPCDVVLPSDVKNSYTAACAPSLDGDAFASAAAANGTSSLRPERVVIIYGITLIGEPVSTQ